MTGTTCLSSGLQTGNAQIYTGRGTLNAVTVINASGGATTLTVYDGTDNTGTVLHKHVGTGANFSEDMAWNLAIRCKNGIYVEVSAGGNYIIYYGA